MSLPTAQFFMQCWGCDRSLSRPYTSPEDCDRQTQELMTQGWQRRIFGPGADPWFCSDDCAHNSSRAKQAEAWWAKKKSQEEISLYGIIAAVGMLLLIGIVALALAVFR